ncbi:hypothetical protein KY284_012963 [Solanum tuberosum]|nr:hypothetical protein KY284_012963 [Solanum tuberosum]
MGPRGPRPVGPPGWGPPQGPGGPPMPGPGGPPMAGPCGFFSSFCYPIGSCLSFFCCCWLLQDCFSQPMGSPGPPRPYGPPPP